MISYNQLEFGDYQTPIEFCDKVIDILKDNRIEPTIILEPTFGEGNFVKSSEIKFNSVKQIYGIELNKEYYDKSATFSKKFMGFNENIFSFNHSKIINKISNNDKLLILGNPPWVTNSQLMAENLKNLPQKSNFKDLKGIDSITGASNFDISEYIIIDLLNNYKDTNCNISMLCKTTVATNIIKEINKYEFSLSDIKIYNFDAKKIFNVNCHACLFIAKISNIKENYAKVYDMTNPNEELYKIGWKNNKFYSRIDGKTDIDGTFPFEWRQGIKHDCSKIMELEKESEYLYRNKNNEEVQIEETLVYPLLKSSELKKNYIDETKRYVIVTQKKAKQDTKYIKSLSPKLWDYLNKHKYYFDNRKSSIYKNSSDFSMFGIGEYSFSKYKVAISGFYKEPNFVVLVGNRKPIMLDDTCYFISFENEKDALITMTLLNSKIVKDFLNSIAFLDKKRPYTKEILKRIDLKKILEKFSFNDFEELYKKYNFSIIIDENDYNSYKEFFINENEQISII